jgi:hypothetical protein
MYRKEVNQNSPIRILEASIHGGLGKGNLGVVMARAGVGKTACLVQIGLDDLLRERYVLHVALDQTIEHVHSWYDAIFEDLVISTDLEDSDVVLEMINRQRMIMSFTDHDLWPERLEKTVAMFREVMDQRPTSILVDGYPWTAHTTAENAAMIGSFKTYAKMLDAELWMSAQTHRGMTGDHPTRLVPPCADYDELIDVAIFLEPDGEDVAVRLLKDHADAEPPDTRLRLHPDTLRLVVADEKRQPVRVPNSAFTLLSGGADGAEAVFGECAEAWGLAELNFSFAGREPRRRRGLVQLSEQELAQGAVSARYVQAHLHRDLPGEPDFRKVLATIWHQVNTAGAVFVVGWINSNGTVTGGTGWAAELAKHWHKPLYVFDQERERWMSWDGEFTECEPPKIEERRFTGAGTRRLSAAGKDAIRGLFERSFGSRPAL